MKRLLLLIWFPVLFIGSVFAQAGNAGKDIKDTLAPYQKYPALPAFNVLEMDSVTIFNTYNIPKGRPVALMFFSPDCGHCKRMTNEIIENMDSLKDVDFYMVTPMNSMAETRRFYAEHHLIEYSNIKLVGRDYEFFFGSYYSISVVPDLALYNEQKKLIKLFQGETHVHDIYEALHPDK